MPGSTTTRSFIRHFLSVRPQQVSTQLMKPPVVTVGLTVYNKARNLRQCLDSVLAQTLRTISVLCVDDGSTDRSNDILASYARLDRRVRVIRNPTNLGPGGARNVGLDEATTEFVQFTD